MKTKLVTGLLILAAFLTAGVRAQTAPMTSPAPAAPTVAPTSALVPNQTVYSPRLPGVNELTNIAAAQGLTVERIEQSSSQITVVYKSASGQTNTVAYLLLPGATGASAAVVTPTSPAPTVVYSPPPAAYYETAPRTVYYDDYGPGYYAYPGYWYPPVSIGLGFGFRSGGFHGGGFRGGSFHGGFGFRR